jgi:hypothetical protein
MRNSGSRTERVPLSGAARYRGNGADVDLYVFGPDAAPIACEVKARFVRKGQTHPGKIHGIQLGYRCKSCAATGL